MSYFSKVIRKIFHTAGSENSKKETIPRVRQEYIDTVAAATGWTREKARDAMISAKKNAGVTYYNYVRFKLWKMPEDEAGRFIERMHEDQAMMRRINRDKFIANRENYICMIAEKNGWSNSKAREMFLEAKSRTGCFAEEYFLFRFYELPEEVQEQVFVIEDSKKIRKRYDTDKHFVNTLFHKELCNEYFSKYLKRSWCVNTDVTEDEFAELFRNSRRIFYKPTMGHHGDDAQSFDVTPENVRDVYRTVSAMDRGVVEEYIVQHHRMQELAPAAVNTLRIATISSNENRPELGDSHIKILYASQKMAGVNSVVDNLVGGGMVAAVDMETGKICSDACDDKGNVFAVHPGTGVTIKGFEIPYFKECIDLIMTIYEERKFEGYLGWDIAITEDGPEIVEVNTAPGVILFQLPRMTEHQYMKEYMRPYFE
jgi:hypothetical protein